MAEDRICPVVRDLLPLWAEGLVSEQTAQFVEAHLRGCRECRAARDALVQPAPPVLLDSGPSSAPPLDSARFLRRWQRRMRSIGAAAAAIAMAGLAVGVYSVVTAPSASPLGADSPMTWPAFAATIPGYTPALRLGQAIPLHDVIPLGAETVTIRGFYASYTATDLLFQVTEKGNPHPPLPELFSPGPPVNTPVGSNANVPLVGGGQAGYWWLGKLYGPETSSQGRPPSTFSFYLMGSSGSAGQNSSVRVPFTLQIPRRAYVPRGLQTWHSHKIYAAGPYRLRVNSLQVSTAGTLFRVQVTRPQRLQVWPDPNCPKFFMPEGCGFSVWPGMVSRGWQTYTGIFPAPSTLPLHRAEIAVPIYGLYTNVTSAVRRTIPWPPESTPSGRRAQAPTVLLGSFQGFSARAVVTVQGLTITFRGVNRPPMPPGLAPFFGVGSVRLLLPDGTTRSATGHEISESPSLRTHVSMTTWTGSWQKPPSSADLKATGSAELTLTIHAVHHMPFGRDGVIWRP